MGCHQRAVTSSTHVTISELGQEAYDRVRAVAEEMDCSCTLVARCVLEATSKRRVRQIMRQHGGRPRPPGRRPKMHTDTESAPRQRPERAQDAVCREINGGVPRPDGCCYPYCRCRV